VSDSLGRDSLATRMARPFYESMLDIATGGRGYLRRVNGREEFYIAARNRPHFPDVYEPPVCEYLRDRVRPGDICLNIGANVGIYTLLLTKWSAPSGRVYSFEPNPKVRAILLDNIRRNGFSDRVSVSEHAVGGERGEATFFADGITGLGRLGQSHPASGAAATSFTVPVATIDEFCKQNRLTPRWIVMDIEGFEIPALEGASETIRAGRETGLNLVVEMHPPLWSTPQLSRSRMDAVLAKYSMRPVPLTGQSQPLNENGMCLLEFC
jgi:FkbM family methyltransferase